MKETEQTLLDQIKDDVAKSYGWADFAELHRDNAEQYDLRMSSIVDDIAKRYAAQPTPNFPKGGTTLTESAYKEFEGKGKLIGHIIDDFKNGKEIFVPAVESSEPQENRTIEDVKNSVARNAGLKDWDEVYKRILPSQIDPLVNQAIRWSIELYKTKSVSAPSESQEEMWKDLGNKWNQMAIIRMGTDEIVNELAKNFKITRNP